MTSHADLSFVKHKARAATLNVVRHLVSLRTRPLPYALPRQSSRGGTVVVCGAGPSLPASLPLVARWQEAGALVFCVNASLPALAAAGITPDVCVVRESVSVGAHLDHPCGLVVTDLAACDGAWERAGAWFCGGYLQHFGTAAALGVRPLYAGTAALTAAVALAEDWGASRIVLVGTDLAFAADGAGYADGSAWAGYRGAMAADGRVELAGAGYQRMLEQSAASGMEGPPQRQDVYRVEAYGGADEVVALGTWVDQLRWLATFAERRAGRIDRVNATGAGARIDGWREGVTALDLLIDVEVGPAMEAPSLHAVDPEAALADIAAQVTRAGDLADTVMHPNGAPTCVAGYLSGHDVIDAAAAGELVAAIESGTDARATIGAVCEAYRSAAKAVMEAM